MAAPTKDPGQIAERLIRTLFVDHAWFKSVPDDDAKAVLMGLLTGQRYPDHLGLIETMKHYPNFHFYCQHLLSDLSPQLPQGREAPQLPQGRESTSKQVRKMKSPCDDPLINVIAQMVSNNVDVDIKHYQTLHKILTDQHFASNMLHSICEKAERQFKYPKKLNKLNVDQISQVISTGTDRIKDFIAITTRKVEANDMLATIQPKKDLIIEQLEIINSIILALGEMEEDFRIKYVSQGGGKKLSQLKTRKIGQHLLKYGCY